MDKLNYESVDEIKIMISMDIIEHFSKNLYRTSTKALEELVTNGYDAIANEVHIYLPGEYVEKRVLVWDDGDSMDIEGLKSLWHIAASPKAKTERVVETRGGHRRQVIGKFGIGKLASYTLGSEISHLCKRNGKYFLISIDYDELQKALPSEKESIKEEKKESYKQKIFELKEAEAKDFLKKMFKREVEFNDSMFERESWTCAIIGSLKSGIKIQHGMIRRVLGRSMPIKPDFHVYLDNSKIESELLVEKALINIDFKDAEFRKKLKQNWLSYQEKNEVEEELIIDPECSEIIFPNLGKTYGNIRVSLLPLRDGAAAKIDRLYGFFIYVKDRLINPEDDLLFLNDPSFATFYRSQFIIYSDGLDDVLLADRERFSSSPEIEEFKILQKSCYQRAVAAWTAETKKAEETRQFKNRLPIHRKELFADPIAFLWSKEMQERDNFTGELEFKLDDPSIELTDLGVSEDVSSFKFEGNKPKLLINEKHPFFEKLKNIARNNTVGKQILAEIENAIAMEAMFEGYLRYLEIEDPFLNSVLNWRESMYRQLAVGSNKTIEGAIEEMKRLSHSGDREFEESVSNVLNMIGFKSRVEGLSGNPDIIAEAFLGEDTYRLVFETKGSRNSIPNAVAAVAAAPAHAKKAQAEHAVIVAREFKGFTKKEFPAIMEECESINRATKTLKNSSDPIKGNISKYIKEKSEHPTVSIMTVENLASLAYAAYQYRYDLTTIKSIFTELESPEEKSSRINKLEAPEKGFDFKNLLDLIYEYQYKKNNRPFARVTELFDDHYSDGDKGVENLNEFNQKIDALSYLAYPFVNKNDERILLTSTPDIVGSHITNNLNKEKSDA